MLTVPPPPNSPSQGVTMKVDSAQRRKGIWGGEAELREFKTSLSPPHSAPGLDGVDRTENQTSIPGSSSPKPSHCTEWTQCQVLAPLTLHDSPNCNCSQSSCFVDCTSTQHTHHVNRPFASGRLLSPIHLLTHSFSHPYLRFIHSSLRVLSSYSFVSSSDQTFPTLMSWNA
jgi:hypothetical protein